MKSPFRQQLEIPMKHSRLLALALVAAFAMTAQAAPVNYAAVEAGTLAKTTEQFAPPELTLVKGKAKKTKAPKAPKVAKPST
jgi:hypothetical protein